MKDESDIFLMHTLSLTPLFSEVTASQCCGTKEKESLWGNRYVYEDKNTELLTACVLVFTSVYLYIPPQDGEDVPLIQKLINAFTPAKKTRPDSSSETPMTKSTNRSRSTSNRISSKMKRRRRISSNEVSYILTYQYHLNNVLMVCITDSAFCFSQIKIIPW